MDNAMRARFVKALEARGVHKGNWAKSSVAVKKPNGKRLGQTFLRDAIERGKGKDEYVQWVCAHYDISWNFVKFGKGTAEDRASLEGGHMTVPEADKIDFIVRLVGALALAIAGSELDARTKDSLTGLAHEIEDKLSALTEPEEPTK